MKGSTYPGSHIDIGASIYERDHFIQLAIAGGLPQLHFLYRIERLAWNHLTMKVTLDMMIIRDEMQCKQTGTVYTI